MATTLRSSSKNSGETGTAISVAEPTGAQVGDLIVVHVHANGQTTIADNNGSDTYTEAPNFSDYKPNTSNGHTASIFYRRKQTGDPATLQFTSGASGRWSVIAMAWQDPHATDDFDVAPNTANATNEDDYDDGTMAIPSITTAVDGSIHVIAGFWDTSADGTIAEPSGYTNIQEEPAGNPQGACYKVISTAGATGILNYSNTEFAAMIGVSYAIKDVGTASNPQTASVAPLALTLTPTTTTATSVSVRTASSSPVGLTAALPSVTATYIQINTASVSPVALTLTPPAVTATRAEVYSVSVSPLGVTATTTTTTATYEAILSASVSSLAITLTPTTTTATYVQVETASVSPVATTLTVPAVTAALPTVYSATVSPLLLDLVPVTVSPYAMVNEFVYETIFVNGRMAIRLTDDQYTLI